MLELMTSYDIPGIQFDRARYPELDCGYDLATVARYAAEHGGAAPPANERDSGWMRWRADKINEFIRNLNRVLKSANWRGLVTNAPIVYDLLVRQLPAGVPGMDEVRCTRLCLTPDLQKRCGQLHAGIGQAIGRNGRRRRSLGAWNRYYQ